MIKLQIVSNKDKVYTDYDEKDITLTECSLMIRELQKIKLNLIDKDFQSDLLIEQ